MSEDSTQDKAVTGEFYEQLCHCAGIAIIATDETMSIRVWNKAAAEMFGVSAEQMLGRPLVDVMPRNRRDLAEQMFRRSLKDHVVSEFEIVHTYRQASPKHLGITVSPIFTGDGRCIGASACVRDITRRVDLEQRLQEHGKMASLGALAGGVAHHFNNILGGVATSVDFALKLDDPSALRRSLRLTADAVQRATKLTHHLLAFAEGDRRPDDLGDLTETVLYFVDETEPELQNRGVDFALDLTAAPVCEVPRHRLLTVLNNLACNALEAMPEGGQLTLALWTEGDEVAIEMTDTGVGIDEQTRRHVFEPFFTTKDGSKAKVSNDEGLGLAVVYGLVREMDGTISLKSNPGEGCQVEIRLPIRRPEST
ncbi:MAG: PAS domain S-box protein [Phycisphaerae bacterium]|nr:PAS domain S-box protein [Phycisphaerae bacterium]